MKKLMLSFLCLVMLQISSFSEGPYTFTTSASTGGTISPSGTILVAQNTNKTFTFAAKTGFQISMVTVDGLPVGAISTYTFTNVIANHIISVAFTVFSHLALGKPAFAVNSEGGALPYFANDADGSTFSKSRYYHQTTHCRRYLYSWK